MQRLFENLGLPVNFLEGVPLYEEMDIEELFKIIQENKEAGLGEDGDNKNEALGTLAQIGMRIWRPEMNAPIANPVHNILHSYIHTIFKDSDGELFRVEDIPTLQAELDKVKNPALDIPENIRTAIQDYYKEKIEAIQEAQVLMGGKRKTRKGKKSKKSRKQKTKSRKGKGKGRK